LSAVEITTGGETLEDGEVNEDAAPKGLLYSSGCFIYVMWRCAISYSTSYTCSDIFVLRTSVQIGFVFPGLFFAFLGIGNAQTSFPCARE